MMVGSPLLGRRTVEMRYVSGGFLLLFLRKIVEVERRKLKLNEIVDMGFIFPLHSSILHF